MEKLFNSYRHFKPFIGFIILLLVTNDTLYSQSENALKTYFEGKTVLVKIDMPASSQGIDVYADEIRSLDFEEYSKRIKKNGIAVYTGDNVMITKIKTKKKHIEFQLAGGGYGTFGDESTHVSIPQLNKSEREKELEDAIDEEKDDKLKKKMQNELRDLQAERRLEQKRLEMEAEQAKAAKENRVRSLAMQSGSRFNIRFRNDLRSEQLYPEVIMEKLSEYVDFSFVIDQENQPNQAGSNGNLHKGMLWEEVAALMGAPSSIDQRNEGSLTVMTCNFQKGKEKITTEFVEGVLIRYSIQSN